MLQRRSLGDQDQSPPLTLNASLTFKNGALCKVDYSSAEGRDGRGSGMLRCPSGMSYQGEFLGLRRDGEGEQRWPNGSYYQGDFKNDQRDGKGQFIWSCGHDYRGGYSDDKRSGHGTYTWPSGATFTGRFAENTREGYGTYISSTGEKYEGEYCDDIRSGEGVVSYPCGRQDVGVWKGQYLTELRFPQVEAYFKPNKLNLLSDCESLKTPDYTMRGSVGPKGYLETASSDLFQAAAQGDYSKVALMLKGGAVYPDVVDSNGHSPLFVAAIHGQLEVVDLLLDNTADINRLDKNGVSILSACLHLIAASSPAVEAILRHKFTDLSSDSATSFSSERTLHTADFGSTQSETFLAEFKIDEEEEDDIGVEETVKSIRELQWQRIQKKDGNKEEIKQVKRKTKEANKVCSSSLGDCSAKHNGSIKLPKNKTSSRKIIMMSDSLFSKRVQESTEGIPVASNVINAEKSVEEVKLTNEEVMLAQEKADCDDNDDVFEYFTDTDDDDEIAALTVSPDIPKGHTKLAALGRQSTILSDVDESLLATSNRSLSSIGDIYPLELKSSLPKYSGSRRRSSSCFPVLLRKSSSLLVNTPVSFRFGSVISAAESTSLLDIETSAPSSPSVSGVSENHREETPPLCSRIRDVVYLLLQRNADPDKTSEPLPPLFYAILSEDYDLVCRIMEKGASLTSSLPYELGGYLPLHTAVSLASQNGANIARALLDQGVDPMLPAKDECSGDDNPNSHSLDGDEERGWTAIHAACAVSKSMRTEAVLVCVQLLVDHGCSVNCVSRGHSPLSLAIVNGHDKVVSYLLEQGADPNLTLRPGVGSALCATTTHMAHRKRSLADSIKLVHHLLTNGANLLMPINLIKSLQLKRCYKAATVLDFAFEAFKEDKRLSQLRYMALSKPERIRYKSVKKLTRYFLCLLRIKAVENIHGIDFLLTDSVPSSEDPSSSLTQQHRPMSVSPMTRSPSPLPLLSTRERKVGRSRVQQQLPLYSLRESLKFIGVMHNLAQIPFSSTSSVGLSLAIEKVKQLLKSSFPVGDDHWTLHSFCFKCGRRAGVRLARCSGCDKVSFCGQRCKDDSWKSWHRFECGASTQESRSVSAQPCRDQAASAMEPRSMTPYTTVICKNQERASTKTVSKSQPARPVSRKTYHNVSKEHNHTSLVAAERVKNSTSQYKHLHSILNTSAHF